MAQVLAGFDQNGAVRAFDEDGDLSQGAKINEALFLNFTRLLTKDEVKKGSFSLELGVTHDYETPDTATILITDVSGSNSYKVNSPTGEYGILYAKNGTGTPMNHADASTVGFPCGLLYYQAGIAVLSASVFSSGSSIDPTFPGLLTTSAEFGPPNGSPGDAGYIDAVLTGSAISGACDDLRHRLVNLSFNNTTELNSTIYFCRANHNDFNYSSNPTYLSASKMVVKNNSTDSPVSYTTAVGLYSADNELLAVAKLSEPLKKDPSSEFTLRVRLDY
jgi:hypothetical protein